MDFVRRLLSRKFLTGLLASGLLVLEKKLGLDLDTETKLMLVGVAVAWIMGETYIDAKGASGDRRPIGERLAELQKMAAPFLPEGTDLLALARGFFARVLGPMAGPSPFAAPETFKPLSPGEINDILNGAKPANGATVGLSDVEVTVRAVNLAGENENFTGFDERVDVPISAEELAAIGGIANGFAGRRLYLTNVGQRPIKFRHLSAKSAEFSQIVCPGNEDCDLGLACCAELKYHGATAKWLLRLES